ncbi:MAG: amidohydrolase [Candidatus Bathyarchaeia archaeon]
MSILIKNCDWIVTQNSSRNVIKNSSVYIEDRRIVEINKKINCEAEYVIDGNGKILLPGLINTHTHIPMSLLRGYADDMALHEWLRNKIWPTEAKLTGDLCYKGALLGCLEMVKSGTTCFLDMYFFMENVAKAVNEAGLRAFLCYAMIDLFDLKKIDKQLETSKKLSSFIKTLGNERIKFVVGPHAPYTCSKETLLKAVEIAEKENSLIHIHIAETRNEQVEFENKYGLREIEYLNKIGFLNPRIVAAHCVWLTKNEIKILKEKGVKVSHCPVSNMKLGVGGAAPLPEMLEHEITVSLGTDGPASNNCLDMFDTMKFCALVHKSQRWDPTMLPAQKVLDLATIEGAKALMMDKEIGSIEEGKKADLILIDTKAPNMMPIHGKDTIVSNLVYSAKGFNVNTTIVNGEILMHNKEVKTLNENDVYEKAQEAAFTLINNPSKFLKGAFVKNFIKLFFK